MRKLCLLVSFVLISANLYPNYVSNTVIYPSYSNSTLVKKNEIERFENDFFVKYEEKIKDGDDFLIKTVFFRKKTNSYYGNEMRYVTWHKIYYHDKDGLDIKNPKEAFEALDKKFNT